MSYAIAANGCWEWQGKLTPKGYPEHHAHREAWVRVNGSCPPDHDIHHTCRNAACVNPDHLEAIHKRVHDLLHFLHERGRTLDDVRQVRADRAAGLSFGAIAKKHGLPCGTVQDWLTKAWLDLLGEGPVPDPPARTCPCCGGSFKSTRTVHVFCSDVCRKRAKDRRRRARLRDQPGASNAKHLDGQPATTEDRHNAARDSRRGQR
jgi:hypothetical protein